MTTTTDKNLRGVELFDSLNVGDVFNDGDRVDVVAPRLESPVGTELVGRLANQGYSIFDRDDFEDYPDQYWLMSRAEATE